MSRSYKKNPISKDGSPERVRVMKKYANRIVRRTFDVPNGKAYRRTTNPYDIHDVVCRYTWEDVRRRYERDLNVYLNGGHKWYRRDEMPDPNDSYYSYRSWYKTFKAK